MRKRYIDCHRKDGNCFVCDLVNCGMDCHNEPISKLELYRRRAGLSYAELVERAGSGLCYDQIQRAATGKIDLGNMSAKNLLAIAAALDVDPYELL